MLFDCKEIYTHGMVRKLFIRLCAIYWESPSQRGKVGQARWYYQILLHLMKAFVTSLMEHTSIIYIGTRIQLIKSWMMGTSRHGQSSLTWIYRFVNQWSPSNKPYELLRNWIWICPTLRPWWGSIFKLFTKFMQPKPPQGEERHATQRVCTRRHIKKSAVSDLEASFI